jgi:hypothetical protein
MSPEHLTAPERAPKLWRHIKRTQKPASMGLQGPSLDFITKVMNYRLLNKNLCISQTIE